MKDTPYLLQVQQQNARPVTGEELEVLGKKAASVWAAGEAENLSDAVVETVKTASLSPEQVKRVAEFANINAFLGEFNKEGADNKYVDFGEGQLADPSRILQDLNDGGDPGEVVELDAYSSPPPEKKASVLDEDLEQVFGPIQSHDYPPEYDNMEYYREREKIATVRDSLVSDISRLEMLHTEAIGALYNNTKVACQSGVPLGDVVRAWSAAGADETLVKCAFEYIAPRLVQDEVFFEFDGIGESITKTSSARIINPKHPLVTSFEDYSAILNKLASFRESLDTVVSHLALTEYQMENEKAASLMGALGRAGKATGRAGTAIGRAIAGKGSGAERVLGAAGKYAPHTAVGGAALVGGTELKNQIEDSPTANLAMSYAVPMSRQAQTRREIRRQQKVMEAQSSPMGRMGLQLMGGY